LLLSVSCNESDAGSSGGDDADACSEELFGVVDRFNNFDYLFGLFGGEGRRWDACGGEGYGGEDSGCFG